MSEIKILSIESLHIKTTVNKKPLLKSDRFARTLIDKMGNKTRQIKIDKKWTEVPEADFYSKVEATRDTLITDLTAKLLTEVKKAKETKK